MICINLIDVNKISICSRRGGVLIYNHKDLSSCFLPTHSSHIEQLFICYLVEFLSFILCGIYFLPSSLSSMYESHVYVISSIVSQYANYFCIFCHDKNLLVIVLFINNEDIHNSYST